MQKKGFEPLQGNAFKNKYKEKIVILQSIGIIVIKSKETRMITYTCKYSSWDLIPNSS